MNENRTEIQQSDAVAVPAVPELTRPGPVYTPAVDIFETDDEITVLADMPGVDAAELTIDLRENVLTLTGRVAAADTSKEHSILGEYQAGTFLRQFTLAETIDQSNIEAKLIDGVLRLELPKIEKAKPRQITVKVN